MFELARQPTISYTAFDDDFDLLGINRLGLDPRQFVRGHPVDDVAAIRLRLNTRTGTESGRYKRPRKQKYDKTGSC
jgi:hypothetical protein